MKRLPVLQFVDDKTCSKCGGECCKRFPGVYWPQDFGVTDDAMVRKLADALCEGKAIIDWWEGRLEGVWSPCWIRPPTADGSEFLKHGVLRSGAWGGACALHTPTGCSLAHDDRPFQCRSLKPKTWKGGRCVGDYTKQDGVLAWIRYQKIISKAEVLARKRIARKRRNSNALQTASDSLE